MTDRLEYLTWCADRATFVERMGAYINPLTGTPLASVIEGQLVPSEGIRIDEIGPITKGDGVYDGEGNVITPPTVVEGHHANFWAVGRLEALLNANGGWEAIFPLLGDMEFVPASDGVPEGWQGTSGMRIIKADAIEQRARVWA